jgi:hypothetical protein
MGDVEMRRLLRRAALEKTQHPVKSQPLVREARADPSSRLKPQPSGILIQASPESPEVVVRKMRALAQLQGRGCSRLQLEREPSRDENHRVAGGADFPVRPALPVAKLAAELVVRHQSHANFV